LRHKGTQHSDSIVVAGATLSISQITVNIAITDAALTHYVQLHPNQHSVEQTKKYKYILKIN